MCDTVFHGEFSSVEDIEREFDEPGALDGARIIHADYDCPPYEGYALVVFEREGELFEVNASHCSCYGLEDQWAPEPTSIDALRARHRCGIDGGKLEASITAYLATKGETDGK